MARTPEFADVRGRDPAFNNIFPGFPAFVAYSLLIEPGTTNQISDFVRLNVIALPPAPGRNVDIVFKSDPVTGNILDNVPSAELPLIQSILTNEAGVPEADREIDLTGSFFTLVNGSLTRVPLPAGFALAARSDIEVPEPAALLLLGFGLLALAAETARRSLRS